MQAALKYLPSREFWKRPPSAWEIATLDRAAKLWPLVMLAIGALLYLPLLDARPLRFEEGRRALQALDMLDGDAWWRLKVLGESYINKPPFTPWLMSAVAWLHGSLDEIAVRLPGVVFALVGGLSAGMAASWLSPSERKVAGLAAGLAFLCSVNLLLKARVGETDVTVTALCGLAFAIWVHGRMRGNISLGHWALIAVAFACSALTKGPIPILFPAIPMVVVPLLQRRFREAVLVCLVILAAHVPLAFWAWSNTTPTTTAHWAGELRLASNDSEEEIGNMLLLNELPLALLYLMPFLPAAIGMVLIRGELPREQRWAVDALVLYALPMTLLTTVLPVGKARYSMPAAWPVAVLAAMWIAMKCRRFAAASVLVGTGVVIALIMQIVQVGFLDGRTLAQRAFRERADHLAAALANLPPGPLPLVWNGADFNHNLLAYAGRRLYLIEPSEFQCHTGGDYLLVANADRGAVDSAGGWAEFAPASDLGMVYRRIADAPVADCVPALRHD